MIKKFFKQILVFTVCICFLLLCACNGKISDITESPTPISNLGQASIQTLAPDISTPTPSVSSSESTTFDAPKTTSTPQQTQDSNQTASATPFLQVTTTPSATPRVTATPKPTSTPTKNPVSCMHSTTKISNRRVATAQADGYSGDMYCLSCSSLVHSGTTIPKSITSSVTSYTMMTASTMVAHQYYDIELEILRLCNIERANQGLASLSFYEDAYCFTKIRADECHQLFEHSRPDGRSWSTVYTDASVSLYGTWGENLYKSTGISPSLSIAKSIVDGWMNSSGHRANILHQNYTKLAVAITVNGNIVTAVQNFFS